MHACIASTEFRTGASVRVYMHACVCVRVRACANTENGAEQVRAYLRDVQDCLDQAIEDLQVCACLCVM